MWSYFIELLYDIIKQLHCLYVPHILCCSQVSCRYIVILSLTVSYLLSSYCVHYWLAKIKQLAHYGWWERIADCLYASCTLTAVERSYSKLEKEALWVVFAVHKFYIYIYGRDFIIELVHQPLSFIFNNSKAMSPTTSSKIIQWHLP